ncbi:short-chain-enoyl-CoA hydratase [Sporomusa sphaeroides DSM 2875]|uniref:short-chain-enoyl-CoA hydratase n=1 Tax=Sporomusa sphaeroides TaxID=47679 RepID=UPI00202DDAC8|nr:short-chain-enoyl-CoA hydratase [Sporomusa sphaeroides DSM 2875]
MDTYNNLIYEKTSDIGVVTINRPKSLNALNSETLREINALFTSIANDSSVKVVIIRGSGEKAFVAGADITEMQAMSAIEARIFSKLGQTAFEKIEKLPQPVIAAINGFALGGGCELAMACDIRIATEKSKFGQPEVLLGVTPGFAGTQRLPRLIGKGNAKELLFVGDMIDAKEAFRIGLINKIVPVEELIDIAMAMAGKIATRAPLAVQLCKAGVNEGLNVDLASATAYEAEIFGLCFSTSDQKEGMSAFIEKREPAFQCK